LNKPVRAATINGAAKWLAFDDPGWRAVGERYNCLEFDIEINHRTPDANVDKIFAALKAASEAFPEHPEIQHAPLVLFGFSASSAAAAITASSPRLSNPNPAQPPQRVLAVIALDEIDVAPYLPPASVPHLFLSNPGDRFSALLTYVEAAKPAVTHDAHARARATDEGAPLTLVTQPGHWHGGSDHGFHNRVDYKFASVWLDEVLKLRLPEEPPRDDLAVLPDGRTQGGWFGAYDVVINTAAKPWGNLERMANVAIGPRDAFHDHRPHIWLPSQYAAEVWRTYASTGSMPSLTPELPLAPVGAYARPPAGKPRTGVNDLALNVAAGPPHDLLPAGALCGLGLDLGPNLDLIVTFDRAIASGRAEIAAGPAQISLPPTFWANTMTIGLRGAQGAGPFQLHLSDVAPADGGPAAEVTVTPLCQ
jgi:hypothetical protein